jgi:prevent-host-death family protein
MRRRLSMPNIMPISELRNYTKVVKEVKYGNRVYLTKNGYDQITLINSKELDEMEKELALYRFKLEMEKGERSIMEEGTISSEELKKELGI